MTPILAAIAGAQAEDLHALSEPGLLESTHDLLLAKKKIDAEIARRLQVMDTRDVTITETGFTTRTWLITAEHIGPGKASQQLAVARALPRYPLLADTFAAGDISHEHVAAITDTLRRLDVEDREVAEEALTKAAREVEPEAFKRFCREIRDRFAADETADERRERLHGSRYLTLTETIDRMVWIEGMLTPEQGAALTAVLTPLAQQLGPEDDRSRGQRNADALETLASAALGFDDLLPEFNGDRPHVAAVVDYDQLAATLTKHADCPPGEDGSFTIDNVPVSPETARILACDAEILPVVMRGKSEVLDIGRSSRVWPKAIRKALQLEDKGCGWPGCRMPLWACRIHHLRYWFHGGATSKANGVHLCAFHHWLTHNRNWKIWRDTLGKIKVART